jgi:hypothetical protein
MEPRKWKATAHSSAAAGQQQENRARKKHTAAPDPQPQKSTATPLALDTQTAFQSSHPETASNLDKARHMVLMRWESVVGTVIAGPGIASHPSTHLHLHKQRSHTRMVLLNCRTRVYILF